MIFTGSQEKMSQLALLFAKKGAGWLSNKLEITICATFNLKKLVII